MLNKFDEFFSLLPSRAINKVTGGKQHSSLCARLFLYQKYVSEKNVIVNFSIRFIDRFEKDHCLTAARNWRIAHNKYNCYFPERYKDYLITKRKENHGI